MKYEYAFINHSAYCFGNILGTLRILSMIHSEGKIPHIQIQESHHDCFNKIVDYLFTGDSKSSILLGRQIDSTMLSKYQSFQIGSWLVEDGVYGGLQLLYWVSRYGWKGEDFHSKCDNKGEIIAVIRITGSFIFGGFSDKPCASSREKWESDDKDLFSTWKFHQMKFNPKK